MFDAFQVIVNILNLLFVNVKILILLMLNIIINRKSQPRIKINVATRSGRARIVGCRTPIIKTRRSIFVFLFLNDLFDIKIS